MAISLKQYDTRVAPKAGAVGVEGSVSLAMDTAGEDQLVNAELLTGLGDAAVGYLEKKKEIKDTADSADYKTRLLTLQTDLESAKVKAIQDGVSYQNIYSEVYTPMLDQFRSDTMNAGYSKDILTAALQNFDYDREAIRQKELAEIERVDLANYSLKIQSGLKDHFANYGFGINPDKDIEFINDLDAYAGIVGKEVADAFYQEIRLNDALNKVQGAVSAEGVSIEERRATLNSIDTGNLDPAAAKQIELEIAQAKNEITNDYNKDVEKATTTVTELMATDAFNFIEYNKIKSSLPPVQQELLDNHIIEITELEKNYQIQNPEVRNGEAVEIMDMVSRFSTGESIIKRNAWDRFWTKDDEPLSYAEVFELGKNLSPEGQTVLYVAMKEAMQFKALNNTPIEVYDQYKGEHKKVNFPTIFESKAELTFDEAGKDFLNELFLYSESMASADLMGWMKQTLINFVKFKKEFPDPTEDQYKEFKAQNFTVAAAEKINTVLSGSVGTTVTPEDQQIIDNAKGK